MMTHASLPSSHCFFAPTGPQGNVTFWGSPDDEDDEEDEEDEDVDFGGSVVPLEPLLLLLELELDVVRDGVPELLLDDGPGSSPEQARIAAERPRTRPKRGK
jgi:hypothetical protein